MYSELNGKVVIVTGALGNLGSALVRRLVAAGMKIVLVDRDAEKLKASLSTFGLTEESSLTAVADITKKAEVEGLIASVVAKFGGVDGLVNVAGGFRMGTNVYDLDDASFDFMMSLNARSVFLMSGAVAKAMIDHGRKGRIVTIASRSALKGDPLMAAYNASKAVALRLTESLAAEVLDKGITVNAVLPSVIDTPQNRAGGASEAEIAKWVTPESLADVIAFLLSDSARDITGASIPVYGRA
jgi:NAD(P)-dependent dehydrogenase (short-subunit alcohol dehydrogenase family)